MKRENLKIKKHWLCDRTGKSDYTDYVHPVPGWTDITGLITSVAVGQIQDEDGLHPLYIQCVIKDSATAKKTLLYADALTYKDGMVDKLTLAARYFHQELLLAAKSVNNVINEENG